MNLRAPPAFRTPASSSLPRVRGGGEPGFPPYPWLRTGIQALIICLVIDDLWFRHGNLEPCHAGARLDEGERRHLPCLSRILDWGAPEGPERRNPPGRVLRACGASRRQDRS